MSPAPYPIITFGTQNRSKIDENFDLVFGRLFGPFGLSLGPLRGGHFGTFWGQVLLFLALASLLDTLRLPKRCFSRNTSKTNRF